MVRAVNDGPSAHRKNIILMKFHSERGITHLPKQVHKPILYCVQRSLGKAHAWKQPSDKICVGCDSPILENTPKVIKGVIVILSLCEMDDIIADIGSHWFLVNGLTTCFLRPPSFPKRIKPAYVQHELPVLRDEDQDGTLSFPYHEHSHHEYARQLCHPPLNKNQIESF